MIFSFLISTLFSMSIAHAASECIDASKCRSQLVRVEVNNNFLNDQLSNPEVVKNIIPTWNSFLGSEAFARSFIRDYPMEVLGFPANVERCLSEKAQGDPSFRDVDCNNPMLCSDPKVNAKARKEVCFSLPCPLLLGRNRRQCPATGSDATPVTIEFPTPVRLTELSDMKTISASVVNKKLHTCIEIGHLEVTLSTRVSFANDPSVKFEPVGLDNIRVKTDGPRQVCMTADVDLRRSPPITGIVLDRGATNFVSDAMIDKALTETRPTGLSGYPPETVDILQRNLLSPLVRHFRTSMEGAIQKALGDNFQEQVLSWSVGEVKTPVGSLSRELGISNSSFRKYVDLLDCAILKQERKTIPLKHNCLQQLYPGSDEVLTLNKIPNITEAVKMISESGQLIDRLTSDTIKKSLLDFSPRMNALGMGNLYNTKLAPIIKKIETNASHPDMLAGVQLITRLGDERLNSSATVVVPELCDSVNPSPHADLSISNCPVQAFVDLNEANRLLGSMYRSGTLCHSGGGDYVPETRRDGTPSYNSNGSPRGKGCLFVIEDDKDGMRCFLNGAPQILYDSATKGYRVQLNTRACYRGAVFLGQGKIGGDINFNIAFTPNVCGDGDFCLENGSADWEVVPGTERFGFRRGSVFHGLIRKTIDKKLNDIIGQTIRIPLARGTGVLAAMPFIGQSTSAGEGYFGACLKPIDTQR